MQLSICLLVESSNLERRMPSVVYDLKMHARMGSCVGFPLIPKNKCHGGLGVQPTSIGKACWRDALDQILTRNL